MIEEPEQIVSENGNFSLFYDENKCKIKKSFLGKMVRYSYEDGMLVNETRKHNIQYFYSNADGNFLCTEIIVNGERYILLYNESGDVEYVCNESNSVICKLRILKYIATGI